MTENASWNHASCYLKSFNQLAASMNAYPDTEKPNSSLNSFLIHSKISQIYSRSKLKKKNVVTHGICNEKSRMGRFLFWIIFFENQITKIKKKKKKQKQKENPNFGLLTPN